MAAGTYRLTAHEIQPVCRPLFCIIDAKEGGGQAVFCCIGSVSVQKSLISEGLRELKWTCPLCAGRGNGCPAGGETAAIFYK